MLIKCSGSVSVNGAGGDEGDADDAKCSNAGNSGAESAAPNETGSKASEGVAVAEKGVALEGKAADDADA